MSRRARRPRRRANPLDAPRLTPVSRRGDLVERFALFVGDRIADDDLAHDRRFHLLMFRRMTTYHTQGAGR